VDMGLPNGPGGGSPTRWMLQFTRGWLKLAHCGLDFSPYYGNILDGIRKLESAQDGEIGNPQRESSATPAPVEPETVFRETPVSSVTERQERQDVTVHGKNRTWSGKGLLPSRSACWSVPAAPRHRRAQITQHSLPYATRYIHTAVPRNHPNSRSLVPT
jgi:hypothetical protein